MSNSITESMILEKPKILYILPFRGKNIYRKKNIKIVLQWLAVVQRYLKDNYDLTLDIAIVEQDREPCNQIPLDNISYIFLNNGETFNKGWSFNVVVKQNPLYQYYGFCDADIIIPAIDTMCDQLAEHTYINPKKAFRLFTNRLDLVQSDYSLFSSFEELAQQIPTLMPKLSKHEGLGFASNMIFMSKSTYEQIGGWDEVFKGWGRYDDFIAHKLAFLCQASAIYAPIDAIHLWHPITLDYSLATSQNNIKLYDQYIKLSKVDLLQMIEEHQKTNGNSTIYLKK